MPSAAAVQLSAVAFTIHVRLSAAPVRCMPSCAPTRRGKRRPYASRDSTPPGLVERAVEHRPGVMHPHAPLSVEQPPGPAMGKRAARLADEPVRFLPTLPALHARAQPQVQLSFVCEVLDLPGRPPFRTTTGITPSRHAKHIDRLAVHLTEGNSSLHSFPGTLLPQRQVLPNPALPNKARARRLCSAGPLRATSTVTKRSALPPAPLWCLSTQISLQRKYISPCE